MERKELSHTKIHYLRAINDLQASQGYARSVDIANEINRTRGSVSIALSRLKHQGLVDLDKNKFVQLTESGRILVEEYTGSKEIITHFLKNILLRPPEQAVSEACQLEDDLSRDTVLALCKLSAFIADKGDSISNFKMDFLNYSKEWEEKAHKESCHEVCFLEGVEPNSNKCNIDCFLYQILPNKIKN